MKTLQIRMKSDDVAEVLMYDMIGQDAWFGDGISAKTFREQVKAIKASTINLRVNSPGGDVFEAGAMMAALDEFKGRVEVDVDGLAASAASYIIMAADTIRMGSNAMMMIHDPHGMSMGNADDMRSMADTLEKVKGQILDAYMRKSKAGRKKLSDWMSAETWMTGQEAVDAGLADSVTEPVRVAALAQHLPLISKLKYRHVPAALSDAQEQAWEEWRRRKMQLAILNFTHNSTLAKSEPEWGTVDKTALPALAFADHSSSNQSDWSYPHHWVENAGNKDENGNWTSGTLYLHKGGLAAAWSAANGGRSGEKASQAVIDHLEAHRKAIGEAD